MSEKLKPPETKETEELTPVKAWQLFFHSYFFSQGESELQYDLFSWLHYNYPRWKITPQVAGYLREMAEKHMSRFVHSEGVHSQRNLIPKNIENDPPNMINRMTNTFNQRAEAPEQAEEKNKMLVDSIALEVLAMDHRYLIKKGGRSRGPNSVPQSEIKNPAKDPFLSHFCYYIIEGQSSPMEEYDSLWRECRKLMKEKAKKKGFWETHGEALKAVTDIYEKYHPGKNIRQLLLAEG